MKRYFLYFFILLNGLFVMFSGCKRQDTKKSEGIEDQLPPDIVISKDNKNLLFSYIDKDGNFRDVSNIDDIPEEYRKQVIVFDLSLPPEKRMAHKLIYIADLTKSDSKGRYRYTIASRYEYESEIREYGQPVVTKDSDNADKKGVIIYTTSWCGVCVQLRKYLRDRGINFLERDIEEDPSAQSEMINKLRAKGIRGSGVPVIDINGDIIVGFNKELLDSKIK